MIEHLAKLPTGITGFDLVAMGGLPKGRLTIVSGSAGAAKTMFAVQYLVEGAIRYGQPGVMVTFEESPSDITRNVKSLGWDLEQLVAQRKLAFVDVSPHPDTEATVSGAYELGGLISRIRSAVTSIGAERVAMDSIHALFTQLDDPALVRREMLRIAHGLRDMGVTSVITAERPIDGGPVARYGVEEFVADNVVILRNQLEQEKRRRTVEVLKFRGSGHQKGEYPFTISAQRGIEVVPLSAIELKQHSTSVRITSGNADIDAMCGGGFFRDSIILVSGATGTGKTLITTHFLAGGAAAGERCLLLAFEESREQLFRNATGWGMDFERLEAEGRLKVICEYPEISSLEDRLLEIKSAITEYKPNRVAVDSLSALERVGSVKSFREFVIGLTSHIKHQEMAGLFTSTTPTLLGGDSVTENHISTLTDSIILLRYVEIFGEMRRGITMLKMRGSRHDKDIREFTIDGTGMHVGKPFRGISGILRGEPQHTRASELERLSDLFKEG